MTDNELKYLIALTLIPNVGSITARKLIAYTGSAEAVFKENKKSLRKIPGIGHFMSKQKDQPGILENAEKELLFIKKHHINVLTAWCKDYPYRLNQCTDAPLVLYYRGLNTFNSKYIISMVGTRRATEYGIEHCSKIIKGLSDALHDIIIVSGLAYGIDYHSHLAALDSGQRTIAVLAHGLHTIYPAEHRRMALKIVDSGALVSDFISLHNPERNNFIKRNRIIAGLSDATLVIESGEKGGALITADIAGSYNRDVFALPGRVNDTVSAGCNKLIKSNKAGMIENAADLMYFLGWDEEKKTRIPRQRSLFEELTDEEATVIRAFDNEKKLSVDLISLRTNIPVSKVSSLMLHLEFKGLVRILPGNYYKML